MVWAKAFVIYVIFTLRPKGRSYIFLPITPAFRLGLIKFIMNKGFSPDH